MRAAMAVIRKATIAFYLLLRPICADWPVAVANSSGLPQRSEDVGSGSASGRASEERNLDPARPIGPWLSTIVRNR